MLTQNKIKAWLAFAGRASLYDNDKISTSIHWDGSGNKSH